MFAVFQIPVSSFEVGWVRWVVIKQLVFQTYRENEECAHKCQKEEFKLFLQLKVTSKIHKKYIKQHLI